MFAYVLIRPCRWASGLVGPDVCRSDNLARRAASKVTARCGALGPSGRFIAVCCAGEGLRDGTGAGREPAVAREAVPFSDDAKRPFATVSRAKRTRPKFPMV